MGGITMALFRCARCHAVYADYYPPDDTCIKCHIGTIYIINTITQQPDHQESGFSNSKEKDQ